MGNERLIWILFGYGSCKRDLLLCFTFWELRGSFGSISHEYRPAMNQNWKGGTSTGTEYVLSDC
jgi:hypothetical protein